MEIKRPLTNVERQKRYREKHREKVRAYQHQYYLKNRKKHQERHRRWLKKHPNYFALYRAEHREELRESARQRQYNYWHTRHEEMKERQKQWRREHPNPKQYPEKIAARVATRKLKKKPCEKCGLLLKVHAHHPDYTKPLEVKWLCSPCHGLEHRRPL